MVHADRDQSVSPDSAVELSFRDGLVDKNILVGLHGDISVGVELSRALSIDVSLSFLTFVVGKLRIYHQVPIRWPDPGWSPALWWEGSHSWEHNWERTRSVCVVRMWW